MAESKMSGVKEVFEGYVEFVVGQGHAKTEVWRRHVGMISRSFRGVYVATARTACFSNPCSCNAGLHLVR